MRGQIKLLYPGFIKDMDCTVDGKQYRCEMSDKDHEALLDDLLKRKGPVIISGYDTTLYNSILKEWINAKQHAIHRSNQRKRK